MGQDKSLNIVIFYIKGLEIKRMVMFYCQFDTETFPN